MSYTDAFLVLCSFLTSIVSGVLGLGGGLILLSVMAQLLPLAVLIPLHGIVQLASNSSRAVVHWHAIEWPLWRSFAVGCLFGAGAGSLVLTPNPSEYFKVVLGVFILVVTYVPLGRVLVTLRRSWWVIGFGNAFASLFLGATGPLLAPFFLKTDLKKDSIVATEAICQVVVHGVKVGVFAAIAFPLSDYAGLALAMVLASILGSYVSKAILKRVTDERFRLGFKVLVTVLAIRLIVVSLW